MKNYNDNISKLKKVWMSKYIFWFLISFVIFLVLGLSFLKKIQDSRLSEDQNNERKIGHLIQ